MELLLNNPDQFNVIRSCEPVGYGHRIKIGDTVYTGSLILTPEKLEMWAVSRVSDLSEEDFAHFANLNAEVVILGTGKRMVFPPVAITRPLMAGGIGLEVMSTATACRTYNVLLGDGRGVAAGLIA